jgi:hypothetical protein
MGKLGERRLGTLLLEGVYPTFLGRILQDVGSQGANTSSLALIMEVSDYFHKSGYKEQTFNSWKHNNNNSGYYADTKDYTTKCKFNCNV